MDAIKEWWEDANPNLKKFIVSSLIVLAVFAILYIAANDKIKSKKLAIASKEEAPVTSDNVFDVNILERDLYDRLQAELNEKSMEMDRANKKMQQEVSKVQNLADKLDQVLKDNYANKKLQNNNSGLTLETARPEFGLGGVAVPPPPSAETIKSKYSNNGDYVFNESTDKNNQQEDYDEVIGGIGHIEIESPVEEDIKLKKNTVHLSPSFMKASVLTGLDATIGGKASENPKPMLLRVAAPAVLPNSVKAQLTGCFIIASGYGSLAIERLDMRLVRLSCVSKDGQSVVEEDFEGYLVDTDGKIGLRARVYMKATQHLNRQAVLGIMEGLSQVISQSAVTTSVSPLGTTNTINPDKAAQAGLAAGASNVTTSLSEFYKMLANETLPSLEVGPKKEITVVLTKGVDLRIRNYCEDCINE